MRYEIDNPSFAPCDEAVSVRGRSSVGRAPQWHCGGRQFESDRLHQRDRVVSYDGAPKWWNWQTRMIQVHVLHGVGVQVPPSAPRGGYLNGEVVRLGRIATVFVENIESIVDKGISKALNVIKRGIS